MNIKCNFLPLHRNHSHPRTQKLLERLAGKYNLDLVSLNIDSTLMDLSTKVTILRMTDQNWQLIIDIPKTINDMGSNPKRIFNCYSFGFLIVSR